MPLVTTKEMFEKSMEEGFAIGAFNINNMEIIQGIVDAAQKQNSPVILQASSGAIKYARIKYLMKMVEAAVEETNIPIAIHLDHGPDFETCKMCIDNGFTSVMIDGSKYSFEENVALTKKVVDYAHERGVVVEAEIGHFVQGEEYDDKDSNDNIYTTAAEAKAFVEATGVDSLAISIGTAHGSYKSQATPVIDFDRLKEIAATIDTPLVLHGGSSSGDENLNKCATNGISKVNIYTDLCVADHKKVQESDCKNYHEIKAAMKQGMMECLEHYYEVFETKKFNNK